MGILTLKRLVNGQQRERRRRRRRRRRLHVRGKTPPIPRRDFLSLASCATYYFLGTDRHVLRIPKSIFHQDLVEPSSNQFLFGSRPNYFYEGAYLTNWFLCRWFNRLILRTSFIPPFPQTPAKCRNPNNLNICTTFKILFCHVLLTTTSRYFSVM